nr:hypothetical protein Q903MT_gene2974 [Picea sitchensis]
MLFTSYHPLEQMDGEQLFWIDHILVFLEMTRGISLNASTY